MDDAILSLLDAARADPDDDGPRLALSDLLEERGEPERAELIRVQCRMARIAEDWGLDASDGLAADFVWRCTHLVPSPRAAARSLRDRSPEFARLADRGEELLEEHGAAWLGGLRGAFHRGLLALTLYVPPPDPEEAEAGVEDGVVPAEAARPEEFRGWTGREAFAWVDRVELMSFGDLGDADWSPLADDPLLRHVTDLDFFAGGWEVREPDTVLRHLARSPHLGRVRRLELTVHQGGWDLDAVLGLGNLPELRRLRLNGWVATLGLAELADGLPFPKLESLDLSRTLVEGDADLRRLAASTRLGALRRLDVGQHGQFTADGVMALVDSDRLPALEDIHFDPMGRTGPDGPSLVARLAASPRAAKLRSLRLNDLGLTDREGEALLASPHLSGARFLRVDGNELSGPMLDRLRARFPVVFD